MSGGTAWRLNLGECTCKSISILINVGSVSRSLKPLHLVVSSLDGDGFVEEQGEDYI